MDTADWIQRVGRLWGHGVVQYARRYLDHRCGEFSLRVSGAEYLREATEQPCLIVVNHVIITAGNAPLGRLTQTRLCRLLNKPVDSFALRRIVREQTGRTLRVVAQSDRGWWSPRPLVYWLQKNIGQSFGKGVMEGMGYIPVEHSPASFHRTFFEAARRAIACGEPILIFPSKIICDERGCRDCLTDLDIADGGIQTGAAHLARKFSLPLLPAYVYGCTSWRTSRTGGVVFGPAFHPDRMTKAQINQAITERVRDLMSHSSVVL